MSGQRLLFPGVCAGHQGPGYLDCLPRKGTGRRHPTLKPNLPTSALFQFPAPPSQLKE